MMEAWKSDWLVEGVDFDNSCNTVQVGEFFNCEENAANSPNVSRDSVESCEEKCDKNDLHPSKSPVKSVSLAKRRLEAYSNKSRIRRVSSKDERTDEDDKADKNVLKKTKKVLYPEDRAKAVIKEIEEIKKKEAEDVFIKQEITREAIAAAMKNIESLTRARSRSLSAEKNRHFKRRDIKSRNYRRTDSVNRKSPSPDDRHRKTDRSPHKTSYPKNWDEYRQLRLTVPKDETLKSKLFNQQNINKLDLFYKLYNFTTPSPLIDPFVCSAEEGTKEIPLWFIRATNSKPHVIFSVNFKNNKDSFLTRAQLFQIIPKEHKQLIEKLINSCSSKSSPSPKKVQSRQWYNKEWRRSGVAECKVLETSVGLSFLQTYSDEEEDEFEEVVICSSTKDNKRDALSARENHTSNEDRKTDVDVAISKPKTPQVEAKKIIEKKENTEREYTPEKILLELKKLPKEDLYETKNAAVIREEVLEVKDKKVMVPEEKRAKKKKRKKKKTKKKDESADSESDDEDSPPKTKRKKNKTKIKTKHYSEDDGSSSEDEKKKNRSRKKAKHKKEKTRKKLKNKKEVLLKEVKAKKRDDSEENSIKQQESKKKKKKNSTSDTKTFAEEIEDESKESKKGNKKKKARKRKHATSFSEESNEDVRKIKEKPPQAADKIKSDRKRRNTQQELSSQDVINIENIDLRHLNLPHKAKSIDHLSRPEEAPHHSKKPSVKDTSEDRSNKKKEEDETGKRRDSRNLQNAKDRERKYSDHSEKSAPEGNPVKDRRPSDRKTASKERRYEEKRSKPEKVQRKYNEAQVPVEKLPNTAKKSRRSDYVLDNICFEEEFPLEKDLQKNVPRRNRFGTPDTEEYRENWEKDPFPLWESEDEMPTKPREKANTSWESDEEIFERGHRSVENQRSACESFDLEIPLNIKPFKRREVIDADTELKLLKIESQSLDEERRRLEIEKLKVKELEMTVFREAESKAVHKNYEAPPPLPKKNKVVEENYEPTHRKHREEAKQCSSKKVLRPKRGRWDKKVPEARISPVPIDEGDTVINISSSSSLNDSSAMLENEYEEFMKALTSNVTPSSEKNDDNNRFKTESISSKCSYSDLSDVETDLVKLGAKKINADLERKPERPNLPPITIDSPVNQTLILPKDIPFIPMPNEVVKPVPVPSPKVDVESIPKPLINLALSTNITLDIVAKVDSPVHSEKKPEIVQIPSISKSDDLVSSSSVEAKIPPLVIDSDIERLFKLAVQKKSENIFNFELITQKESKTTSLTNTMKPIENVAFASPLTDISLDSTSFDESSVKKDREPRTEKPFSFSGMVLPTKKILLNSSKVNLGDSDEDDDRYRSLRKLDDIKRENLNAVTSFVATEEKQPVHPYPQQEKNVVEFSTDVIKQQPQQQLQQHPTVFDMNTIRPRSPPMRSSSSRYSGDKSGKRDSPPRRSIQGRRSPSPRRRSSPRRRGHSPPRRHASPRRRSPIRRKSPPGKRRYSSRRSNSPSYRRRSISPRRKSPRRSISPGRGSSAKRPRSKSPERHKLTASNYKPAATEANALKSPVTIASPLERLKRSVADSTISDDLLPQPSFNLEEYTDSPVTRFYDRNVKSIESPMRVPLDVRISQVLGYAKVERKQVDDAAYDSFAYEQGQYSQMNAYMDTEKVEVSAMTDGGLKRQNAFVQVGNMVQIVPTDMHIKTEVVASKPKPATPPKKAESPKKPESPLTVAHHQEKSTIVQVGNMLQIVPADLTPDKIESREPNNQSVAEPVKKLSPQEKQSAETVMKLKVAEQRAEREQRRQEKEKKRKEKEKRKKEKEKQRQIKLKQKTENMIKRALQLEVEGLAEGESMLNETPTQWPPISVISSKDANKSILRGACSKRDSTKLDKRKIVQFADGVKPGEGTSPSGGEELSSPPPKKTLPKEKRYKKTKLLKKIQKKKVKVKVIKKLPDEPDSDEDDNLPPPSPPPGSPPPHLFPPRVKTPVINNIHPFATTVLSVQTSTQQTPRPIYRPPLNLIMVPPPPPHHHHHHGPPPPPPHHGPPHPHHGPPHHHHGPPPPPPHHRPLPPHHGPPPPPGPPPHHHHPPPPPGPPHGPPPFHY